MAELSMEAAAGAEVEDGGFGGVEVAVGVAVDAAGVDDEDGAVGLGGEGVGWGTAAGTFSASRTVVTGWPFPASLVVPGLPLPLPLPLELQ